MLFEIQLLEKNKNIPGEVTVEENGEEVMVPSDSTSKREPVPLFIPTHDWQVVKKGIGLHIYQLITVFNGQ